MNAPTHTPAHTALAVALGIAASGTPLPAQASTPVTLAAERSRNVLPAEALWRLADLYISSQSWKEAASVLNELARDAERFGNAQIQVQALLEASLLYSKAGMHQEVNACARRLDELMGSPSSRMSSTRTRPRHPQAAAA